MEDKLEPLEELSQELARNFGYGLRIGVVVGLVGGIAISATAGKISDLIIRRQRVKEARLEAKVNKKD